MKQITYGMSEDIGWRFRMENAHAVCEMEEFDFFAAGVYDGHIDPLAAQEAADALHRFVQGFIREEFQEPPEKRRSVIEIIKQAYLAADERILSKGLRSGTAAATFYIIGEEFWAANAGDVRIVMDSEEGPLLLTQDHRPDLAEERRRVESLGGRVIELDVPRVEGDLALSRALGDALFKPYVTPLPRIVHGFLGKDSQYALLACDGIWASLAVDEVCTIVRKATDPQKAAEQVVQEASHAGSEDNMTAIVLDLKDYARPLVREKMSISHITDTALD